MIFGARRRARVARGERVDGHLQRSDLYSEFGALIDLLAHVGVVGEKQREDAHLLLLEARALELARALEELSS